VPSASVSGSFTLVSHRWVNIVIVVWECASKCALANIPVRDNLVMFWSMIAQPRTSDMEAIRESDIRRGFTQKQDAAINLLATGYSMADAAAVLGVSRSAVLKWKRNNPSFRDEINRRRGEIETTGVQRSPSRSASA
jgi:hypothetical protein